MDATQQQNPMQYQTVQPQPQPQFIQQPQQQVVYFQVPPRLIPYNRTWNIFKIIFNIIAIIFAIILLGIGGGSTAIDYDGVDGDFIEIILYAGPAVRFTPRPLQCRRNANLVRSKGWRHYRMVCSGARHDMWYVFLS